MKLYDFPFARETEAILALSGPVLRDTARLSQRYPPSLCAMGFLVSQHGTWPIGCDIPSPFSGRSPL